ncbi:MAG: hypothetical protein JO019_00005, partial [Candidatus Kaiserbacteria bacterium]|nr:hypothetical protein [Candidatus Kaiserbacteria bacterium]
MPPRSFAAERPRVAPAPVEKFKSPEEELAYLRARVAQKEQELEVKPNRLEQDRLAKREIAAYADVPAATILHETVIMPEHETVRHLLKLEPEIHDKQLDGLLEIVSQRGIRNALSVAARMKNPHLEDDFHRALIRYVAEGLPDKGLPVPEKVSRALHMVLFEVQPQAHGENTKEQGQQKLEQLLSSSEQLYSGLMALIDPHEGFSLEIAVPEGTEQAALYLSVPRAKQALAERLISSVFPNARISEQRGDYNIFNYDGAHAAAYAELAHHPAYPLKTPDMFEHDPMNVLLAAFSKIAKHGEGAALQITVGTEGDRYNNHYKKILRHIERGQHVEKAVKVAETAFGEALHDTAKMIFMPGAYERDIERERSVRTTDQVATEVMTRKVKSRIAPVSIRLVASAPDQARANDLLSNLIAPFSQYDDPRGNQLKFKEVGNWRLQNFLRDFTYREFEPSIAIPLSLAEVTSIFHFTAERVTTSRELKKSYAKQAPAPVEVGSEGITIGINRYGGQETPVHYAPPDRLRHTYVIGQTGTG